MIHIVSGDICDSPTEQRIIQQNNCKGVARGGLAGTLARRYRGYSTGYKELCDTGCAVLGAWYTVRCTDSKTGIHHHVICAFAQDNYGHNGLYTSYDALEQIFKEIDECYGSACSFAIPYGIGCGLGGGDWNIVYKLIETCFVKHDVYIYKLPEAPWFGFTEGCDPSVTDAWVNNLSPYGNVIISKNLTDGLIDMLVALKHKIIFHHTVTGFGGRVLEKNVPSKEWSRQQCEKLFAKGFPVEHYVLRVDPVICTEKGTQTALSVMDLFRGLGISRVRFSFLDMYPHVKKRFIDNGIPLPYETFNAPREWMMTAVLAFINNAKTNGYRLESCAEDIIYKVGCLSQYDYDIFGVPYVQTSQHKQRSSCACLSGKKEILPRSCNKCDLGCLYCYWK